MGRALSVMLLGVAEDVHARAAAEVVNDHVVLVGCQTGPCTGR